MQQLPATQAPTLLIPPSRQFNGGECIGINTYIVSEQQLKCVVEFNEGECIGINTYIVSEQPEQLKCVFEYSTIVHGKNDTC